MFFALFFLLLTLHLAYPVQVPLAASLSSLDYALALLLPSSVSVGPANSAADISAGVEEKEDAQHFERRVSQLFDEVSADQQLLWETLEPLRRLVSTPEARFDLVWLPTTALFEKYGLIRTDEPPHFCDPSIVEYLENAGISNEPLPFMPDLLTELGGAPCGTQTAGTTIPSIGDEKRLESFLWSLSHLQHDAFSILHGRSTHHGFSKEWVRQVFALAAPSTFEDYLEDEKKVRREVVRQSIRWVWSNLRSVSLGAPEIFPVNGTAREDWSGAPVSLIDGLDTLLVAGFTQEAAEGIEYLIGNSFDAPSSFNRAQTHQSRLSAAHEEDVRRRAPQYDRYSLLPAENVNFFETNIRQLGGLLSAYGLTKEPGLLRLAHALGSQLSRAFPDPQPYPSPPLPLRPRSKRRLAVSDASQREREGEDLRALVERVILTALMEKRASENRASEDKSSKKGVSESGSPRVRSPSEKSGTEADGAAAAAKREMESQAESSPTLLRATEASTEPKTARSVAADIHNDTTLDAEAFQPHYCQLLGGNLSSSGHESEHRDRLRPCCDLGGPLRGQRRFVVSHLPASDVRLRQGSIWRSPQAYIAEAGTLQLEYLTLGNLVGNCAYHDMVDAVIELLEYRDPMAQRGVVAVQRRIDGRVAHMSLTSLGFRGDSYYEYIVKEYIMTGKKDPFLRSMLTSLINHLPSYVRCVQEPRYDPSLGWQRLMSHPESTPQVARGVDTRVLDLWEQSYGPVLGGAQLWSQLQFVPVSVVPIKPDDLAVGQELLFSEIDTLTCFLPGLLTLLAANLDGLTKDAQIARSALQLISDRLVETCVAMYFGTFTGLNPETTMLRQELPTLTFIAAKGSHTLLRPETLESLTYLAHLPRSVPAESLRYENWSWRIFMAMLSSAQAPYGFSSLSDFQKQRTFGGAADPTRGSKTPSPGRQETWILAETLKYLFLTFSDNEDLQRTLVDPLLRARDPGREKYRSGLTAAAAAAVSAWEGYGNASALRRAEKKMKRLTESPTAATTSASWLDRVLLTTEAHFVAVPLKPLSCGRVHRLRTAGCLQD